MEPRSYRRIGLTLFILFTTVAALVAYDRVNQLARTTASLRELPFTVSEALLQAHDEAFELHGSLHDAVMAADQEGRQWAIAASVAHEEQLRSHLSIIATRFIEQPKLLAPLFGSLADFAQFRATVVEMLDQGRTDEAHALMSLHGEAIYRRQHQAMSAVLGAERAHAADLRAQAAEAERTAHWASLGLAVLAGGALAVTVLGYKIFVTTHRPLMRLRASLLGLAAGDATIQVPLQDQAGTIGSMARAIQLFKDSLIERDAANAALMSAAEEARRANEAKSRFLSAASHDLRQPLQAIRLYLETLDHSLTHINQRRALTGALNALSAGEELLSNYMDVSVLDSGLIIPEVGVVPADAVLREVALQCAPAAQAKGLRLRVVPCTALLESDPRLLQRLLTNLVANAIRFTDAGSVLVGCRQTDRWVRIEVWDTGVGIPADKLDEVFEDFYQVGNTERDRTKGLGLGLSVVDRAARLLGHSVTVRSSEGHGSVFAVTVAKAVPEGVRNAA